MLLAPIVVQFRSIEAIDGEVGGVRHFGCAQDKEGLLRHHCADACELLQQSRSGCIRLHQHEGGVTEDHIHGSGRGSNRHGAERITLHPSHAVGAAERKDVGLQELADISVLLHAHHLRRAATGGFEPERPDARKEVEHSSAVEPSTQDVEHRLLRAGTHRASAFMLGHLQPSRSKCSSEDLEHREIVDGRRGFAPPRG